MSSTRSRTLGIRPSFGVAIRGASSENSLSIMEEEEEQEEDMRASEWQRE